MRLRPDQPRETGPELVEYLLFCRLVEVECAVLRQVGEPGGDRVAGGPGISATDAELR